LRHFAGLAFSTPREVIRVKNDAPAAPAAVPTSAAIHQTHKGPRLMF
jgi:hypothetical protein